MKRLSGLSTGWAAVLLVGVLALAGCGRKGAPIPDHSRDEFSFSSLSASAAADGTVSFRGTVAGASQNLEYMVLEMQSVDGELCEGCPFLPQEQQRFDARDALESSTGNSFSFVFRPVFGGWAYRWRLVGHNIYAGLPDVTSSIQTVSMDGVSLDTAPVQQTGD